MKFLKASLKKGSLVKLTEKGEDYLRGDYGIFYGNTFGIIIQKMDHGATVLIIKNFKIRHLWNSEFKKIKIK